MNFHGGYKGINNLIDLSVNLNVFSPKIEYMKDTDYVNYPDIDGKSTLNIFAKKNNIDIENLILGNGAIDLIYLYARAIKPKNVLIIGPTFNEYNRAFKLVNSNICEYVLSSENNFKLELDKLNLENFDLLIICSPNNPTGIYYDVEEIVKITRNYNIKVLIDESFLDFYKEEKYTVYDNVLRLRSMTKFYAIAGIRLGYAISDKNIINKMYEYKEPWSINAYALNAFKEIIENNNNTNEIRKKIKIEREYLTKKLQDKGIKVFNSSSNFILIKVINIDEFYKRISSKFYLRRCFDFTGLGESFFRIRVSSRDINDMFLDCLKDYQEDNYGK